MNFEIWKSAGGSTSVLPIYVKAIYTAAGTGSSYRIHLSIGTGVDAGGNITGGVLLSANAPTTVGIIDFGSNSTSSTGEMDFSGDADNCRWILWRGGPVSGYNSVVVIDRAKTSAGADSDAFVYVGSCITTTATATSRNSILFRSDLGSVLNQSILGWRGVVYGGGGGPATNLFGAVSPYPIFPPIVGHLGNPLLGAMGFRITDVTDGTVVSAWIYGASHSYLVNANTSAVSGNALDGIASYGVIPAIRWE